MQQTARVGILGGTFNPVHLGHLILAQSAMEAFDLGKVLFIPCGVPPHKNPGTLIRDNCTSTGGHYAIDP